MSDMTAPHDSRKMSFHVDPKALLNFGGETSHGGPVEDDITWEPRLDFFSRDAVSRRGSLREDPSLAPVIDLPAESSLEPGDQEVTGEEGHETVDDSIDRLTGALDSAEKGKGKGKDIPTGHSDPRTAGLRGWAFGSGLAPSPAIRPSYNPKETRLFPYSGPSGTYSPTNVQAAFGPSRGGRTSVLSSRSGGNESQKTGRGLSEYKGPNYEELTQIAAAASDRRLADAVVALVDEVNAHRKEVESLREDLKRERDRRAEGEDKTRNDMAKLLTKLDELDAKLKVSHHGPAPAAATWTSPPSGPSIQVVSAPNPSVQGPAPRRFKGF